MLLKKQWGSFAPRNVYELQPLSLLDPVVSWQPVID
jgi:hypothetical protein